MYNCRPQNRVFVTRMAAVLLFLGENRTTVPFTPKIQQENIKLQPQHCEADHGLGYTGTLSVTHSGKLCLPWASEKARQLSRSASFLPDVRLLENYCRNPDDDEEGVWCYIDHPNTTFEYCDLHYCGKEPARDRPLFLW